MTRTPLLTVEDAKVSFNLFCCVYGIGTLGMPGNFARAGPVCGIIALAFMAFVNVYASVVCSRVMLKAPTSVKSFADLGEWALGPRGRIAIVVSQMGVCLFVPCAFLVLGGTLLDVIIPDAFPPVVWTIFMAISILPVTLIPTLKEGAGAALAGCLGTILADFIALGILVHYLYDTTTATIPSPSIDFDSIASTFGNLSLAYGAAIVIPDLQRQHSQPERMPRVVFFTMSFVSILFVVIASTGYAMVGCQIPGNLLFAVSGSALGFSASRGAVVLAFMAMQLHITIGFSVILHPSFYYMERLCLGLHHSSSEFKAIQGDNDGDDDGELSNIGTVEVGDVKETSDDNLETKDTTRESLHTSASTTVDDDVLSTRPSDPKFIQCRILRTSIVVILTLISVLLHEHFHELVDLVGASSVALSCIILPIACHMSIQADTIGKMERLFCYFAIGICGILSIYVTIKSAIRMTAPSEANIVFPYCPVPYQLYSYTNISHYSN